MADEINTLTAGRLRTAMKQVAGNGDASADGIPWGDEVCICAPLADRPNGPKQLVIKKDGKPIGAIMITRGTLKRLGNEMQWWKQVHSGSQNAFRHGNRP